MEKVGKFHTQKEFVLNILLDMSRFERIRLIDRYTKIAEEVFHRYTEDQIIDIIAKIVKIKFSKQILIDFFVSGESVVDHPDCRLEEFLIRELAH